MPHDKTLLVSLLHLSKGNYLVKQKYILFSKYKINGEMCGNEILKGAEMLAVVSTNIMKQY
jgi:hypothetical protein